MKKLKKEELIYLIYVIHQGTGAPSLDYFVFSFTWLYFIDMKHWSTLKTSLNIHIFSQSDVEWTYLCIYSMTDSWISNVLINSNKGFERILQTLKIYTNASKNLLSLKDVCFMEQHTNSPNIIYRVHITWHNSKT